MKGKKIRNRLIIVLLAGLLAGSLIIGVTFGTTEIKADEVWHAIWNGLTKGGSTDEKTDAIVFLVRLPRIVLACIVGMGLTISGIVMQAIVKNPLADPYILGISSGATLGATLAIMLGIGSFAGGSAVGLMGFIGALLASALVMIVSSVGGKATSVKLVLSGMAISAISGAISNFVIFISNKNQAVSQIVYWTMGGFGSAKWFSNGILLVLVVCALIFFLSQWRILNLMLLGDELAITMGKDLEKYRMVYMVIVSLLVGFCVYTSGMIGFVGLVIPHITRMIFGSDHRQLLVSGSLIGGIFMIWSDVLCRTIMPGSEMPIGILTSLIGAPIFIYLIVKSPYGFGGGEGEN